MQKQTYEKMKKLGQGYKIFGRSVTNQPYHQPDLNILESDLYHGTVEIQPRPHSLNKNNQLKQHANHMADLFRN